MKKSIVAIIFILIGFSTRAQVTDGEYLKVQDSLIKEFNLKLDSIVNKKHTILSFEAGTSTVKTPNYQFAALIGIQNLKGDQANFGGVIRYYKNKPIYGFELFAKLQIDKNFLFFIQGCGLTGKQTEKIGENGYPLAVINDFPRLELSAGLGVKVATINFLAGITNEEYDPFVEKLRSPSFLFKVQKNITFK